jgi:hypothetical protein
MNEAAKILFETKFGDIPLFISQLDLATSLLNDPDTAYYVEKAELEKYSKALTRLKTYVSQLLSSTVARSITEDFASGLLIVISKKLQSDYNKAKELVDRVILDLREKNAANAKNDAKHSITNQFTYDLDNANYIAVITSKPLEIGLPDQGAFPPLRRYLFNDLLKSLYDPNKDLKYYRFNFPTSSYGFLFWRGLKKILVNYFQANPSQQLLDSLDQKFAIKANLSFNETDSVQTLNIAIEEIVNRTLKSLNSSRYILVFITEAPIYSLPIVAIDPSDNKKIKIYSLLETEADRITYNKLPEIETLLWRMFVWDQLKSPKYAGEEIKYCTDN